LALVAAVFAIAGQAHATVNGGTVAAGAASISTNGATTVINQVSDRAIINWKGFDIGAGEKVQINQPDSYSAILNRVNATTGTHIDGELNANGQVYVVNPNGIVVGRSGNIKTNGVILSTLDVSDTNFMEPIDRNRYGNHNSLHFRRAATAPQTAIVNDGTITAAEGGISLFGVEVINSATGTLQAAGAEKGRDTFSAFGTLAFVNMVNLSAADSIDATQYYREPSADNGFIFTGLAMPWSGSPSITSRPGTNNFVANKGTISVAGGRVSLVAAKNDGEAIRNTGSIVAEGFSPTLSRYSSLASVELTTNQTSANSGAVYVGGNVQAAGEVIAASGNAPLIVDGSILANSNVRLRAPGGNIGVNAGADIFSGRHVLVNSDEFGSYNVDGAVSLDGRVTAASNVYVAGDTVSVNGIVTARRTTDWDPALFIGNHVELGNGTIVADYYDVDEGGKTTRYAYGKPINVSNVGQFGIAPEEVPQQ
jgi:filamentous hemagglutinin family protein